MINLESDAMALDSFFGTAKPFDNLSVSPRDNNVIHELNGLNYFAQRPRSPIPRIRRTRPPAGLVCLLEEERRADEARSRLAKADPLSRLRWLAHVTAAHGEI